MVAPRASAIFAQSCRRTLLPARVSLDSRRYISAYGYTQAKAIVFPKHGEPKDVLKYIITSLDIIRNLFGMGVVLTGLL